MTSSNLRATFLICGRYFTAAIVATLIGAAGPDDRDGGPSSPGFVVVPDQSQDQARDQDAVAIVSFEPAASEPSQAKAPMKAIPKPLDVAEAPAPLAEIRFTPSAPVASASAPRHVRQVSRPSLPVSLPPPMIVRVSFPARTGRARATADRVASMLRAYCLSVELTSAARTRVSRARVVYAFAEDRPAAETVDRTLRAASGLDGSMTLDPASVSLRRPGLIEVALPG
jgi:hypothetical protein